MNGGTEWRFALSPDGASVVYCTDQEVRLKLEIYVVPIGGGVAPLKLSQTLPGTQYVESNFRISPNGERVIYRAPFIAEKLYSVPIDRSAEPIQISGPVDSNGRVRDFVFLPGGQSLVYRSDQLPYEGWNFFRVPIAGGATPLLVNDPAFPSSDAYYQGPPGEYFQVTPDGEWVLYNVSRPLGGYNLRGAVTIPGSAASYRVNAALVQGGSVFEYELTPDGSQVIYRASQDTAGVHELYRSFLAETRPHARVPHPQ